MKMPATAPPATPPMTRAFFLVDQPLAGGGTTVSVGVGVGAVAAVDVVATTCRVGLAVGFAVGPVGTDVDAVAVVRVGSMGSSVVGSDDDDGCAEGAVVRVVDVCVEVVVGEGVEVVLVVVYVDCVTVAGDDRRIAASMRSYFRRPNPCATAIVGVITGNMAPMRPHHSAQPTESLRR